jgi:hypothetical protein
MWEGRSEEGPPGRVIGEVNVIKVHCIIPCMEMP